MEMQGLKAQGGFCFAVQGGKNQEKNRAGGPAAVWTAQGPLWLWLLQSVKLESELSFPATSELRPTPLKDHTGRRQSRWHSLQTLVRPLGPEGGAEGHCEKAAPEALCFEDRVLVEGLWQV